MKQRLARHAAGLPLFIAFAALAALACSASAGQAGSAETLSMNLNFFTIANLIENELPLTVDKLENIGFIFDASDNGNYVTVYVCCDVQLNDGVILKEIELRVIGRPQSSRAFFSFTTKGTPVSRGSVEKFLGITTPVVVPRGNSWDDEYVLKKQVGEFVVMAGYRAGSPQILNGLSFSSVTERPK